jgi:hypothetical protein
VVNESGAIVRHSGATSSAPLTPPGYYEVIFDRDVSGCSYQATIAAPVAPGETLVQPRSNNVNGVFVITANSSGSPLQKTFHLAVFC